MNKMKHKHLMPHILCHTPEEVFPENSIGCCISNALCTKDPTPNLEVASITSPVLII